jgi:cellulose synthase/poly-beta-1,6-N-acetylglucosamine synthase-like glycosyltransferase
MRNLYIWNIVMTKEKSGRATVSLTMIVRNEEANLPRCLESVRGLFDEMVVVDTGSTDCTKALAMSWGPSSNGPENRLKPSEGRGDRKSKPYLAAGFDLGSSGFCRV